MKLIFLFSYAIIFTNCATKSNNIKLSEQEQTIYTKPLSTVNRSFRSNSDLDSLLKMSQESLTIPNYNEAIDRQKLYNNQKTNQNRPYRIQFISNPDLNLVLRKQERYEQTLEKKIDIIFEDPFYKLQLGNHTSKSKAQIQLRELEEIGIFGFIIKVKK